MKKRILSLLLTVVCMFGVVLATACNDTPAGGDDVKNIEFVCNVSSAAKKYYIQAVKEYNEGQGKIDGVYVNGSYSVASGNIGTVISSANSNTPNVVCVAEADFKGYAYLDYFLQLDSYLTPAAKETLNWNQIPACLYERYGYNNTEDQTIGKRLIGKDQPLLGLPAGSNPLVLFYRSDMLKALDINIVSIPEEELAGTNYMPHGYAEYKNAPADGLKKSTNKFGKEVYKVFNDQIPMNWEEIRYLANYIRSAISSCKYGYMSEYWFEYGWSVGGDCMGWDIDKGEYVFTLNDKTANYLVLDTITVNGKQHVAGDVLNYEEKGYVNANLSAYEGKIYEIPSTYEAFLEFNRYGVPSDKITDIKDGATAIYGYGLAKDKTGANNSNFLSTTSPSPFYSAFFSENVDFENSIVGGNFSIAPEQQYREFVGGSLVDENKSLNEQELRIIGETYDGSVYTGELKKVNGVPVVGKTTTASLNNAICIAKNSDPEEYEASFKFITWFLSPAAQKITTKGSTILPIHQDYAFSDEYLNADERTCNFKSAVRNGIYSEIGDWSYFDEGSWVTDWAGTLNSSVRKGSMMLSSFFTMKVSVANTALSKMDCKVFRSCL